MRLWGEIGSMAVKSRRELGYAAGAALAFLGLTLVVVVVSASSVEDPGYVGRVKSWQAEREENLQKDGSWLTVAGLYWLREGENWVGTATSNDFVLPEDSAPAVVGVFKFHDRKATFHAEEGVSITRDGKPIQKVELEMGESHAIAINDLKMWLHHSGERLAIRLRDLNASYRREFAGLDWYPVDPSFRVQATFTPHAEEKKVEMLNILGDIEVFEVAGYVDFELHGQKVRMEAEKAREGALKFTFRDGTSGKGSYPAARFLRTERPDNGKVVMDFNQAYNPPCAYNPFTTCPMPTKENRLEVPIEAGEKNYKKHS